MQTWRSTRGTHASAHCPRLIRSNLPYGPLTHWGSLSNRRCIPGSLRLRCKVSRAGTSPHPGDGNWQLLLFGHFGQGRYEQPIASLPQAVHHIDAAGLFIEEWVEIQVMLLHLRDCLLVV